MSVPEQFHEIVARALATALDGRPAEEVERFLGLGGVGRMLDESLPDVSQHFADSLVETMPEMVAHRRGFQAAVLKMADESGEEFVTATSRTATASRSCRGCWRICRRALAV
jgi:hypothetical protein